MQFNIPSIGVKDIPEVLDFSYRIHKKSFKNRTVSRDLIERRPLMFWGAPGIGKSASILTWAYLNNLKPYILIVSQIDPIDLRGLPHIKNMKNLTISSWATPEFLPQEGMSLKHEDDDGYYDGSLLFLDELSTTPPENIPILYQLLLNGRIGEHILPDNCLVCAAGNRPDDGALAYNMNTALSDRLTQCNVALIPKDFLEYATNNNFHPWVLSYLKQNPEKILGADQQEDCLVQATPRSWKSVSEHLYEHGDRLNRISEVFISGTIGADFYHDFNQAVSNTYELPDIKDYFQAKNLNELMEDKYHPKNIYSLFSLVYSLNGFARQAKEMLRTFEVMACLLEKRLNPALPLEEALELQATGLINRITKQIKLGDKELQKNFIEFMCSPETSKYMQVIPDFEEKVSEWKTFQ